MNKSTNFHGKSINFYDSGKGQALVLLHGFLESGLMWDRFTQELSKEFRVIAIDLPGFGKTPVVAEKHSMELMAGAVKAVMDDLKITSCIMIGHSLGGYITLEFAVQYPELLKGICLFHSHASADTAEARENRRRTINIVKLNRKCKGLIKTPNPLAYLRQKEL
nr:alpha/beta fold hydrolase [Bacteroidota bacterium]